MLRKGMLILALIGATQGLCFGQGILDSVLGPGGLGIWGGDSSHLTNQQYPSAPPQQQPPYQDQQPAYPGQQAPYPGAGYPQNPYYNQQGVYGDWQNYPPATIGGAGQDQYPAEQQYQPPQYSTQTQTVPQVQGPPQVAPQQPPVQAQMQQPMLPRQYPPGPPPVRAEDLPAGAVRITTTTPDGTTVQFYPPDGQPMQEPGVAPPQQPRRMRAKPSTAKQAAPRATQPREKTGAAPSSGDGVAMPKPVEVPQGDPRYGWGSAINRAPVAPEVR
jgi:hypothetical protein